MSTRLLFITVLVGSALAILTSIALAMQPPEPLPTPIEVIETGQAAWTAFSAGSWVLGIGLTLTLVIQLFRAQWLGGLFNAIPHRWRVSVPLALSGIASALLYLHGDMPPDLAAVLAPAIAGVSIGAHSVSEGVRAKRPGYSPESLP